MESGELPVPLDVFQRHFLITHFKDKANTVLDQIGCESNSSGKPLHKLIAEFLLKSGYTQSGFHDDNWFSRKIPLDGCYFAHTDFRHETVPKDDRFIDYLPSQRFRIESGEFPCSSQIRSPWSGVVPEPLVQERAPGRYYVLDGQLRVIRHWFHGIPVVKVFVYRGRGDV